MKFLTLALLFILLLRIDLSAQFSIDKFFNESFDRTYSSVKDSLSQKKTTEKETMGIKAIMYYDYYEPLSVSVGYMFKDDNKLMGRMLVNGKEDEESANKLFNRLKKILTEKFGPNNAENSMLGVTILSWNGNDQFSATLTKQGDGASIMLMRKNKK